MSFLFFFFNDTATTEIYTLSLHDALPISIKGGRLRAIVVNSRVSNVATGALGLAHAKRSEEHTSELQSQSNLVCRLLLEKKKTAHRHTTDQDHHTAHARTTQIQAHGVSPV